MTRPHLYRLTTSPFQRSSVAAALLALNASVGCSGENPAGLRSTDIPTPTRQLLAPTSVSRLTMAEVNAGIAEVESMRASINGYASLGYPIDPIPALSYPATISLTPPASPPPADPAPPPTDPTCPTCLAYSVGVGAFTAAPAARHPTRGQGRVRSSGPTFLFVGCPFGGYQCQQHCDELRYHMKSLGADYWRAYREFVTNFFPEFWRLPENFFIGGPVDVMRTTFRNIYLTKLTYDADCTRLPSGGGGGSGF